MKLPALALLMLLQAPTELTIDVLPRVVMQNGSVRLRCRVPKDPENRKLRWGFEFHRTSESELHGAESAVTWERIVQEIPCDPGPAFCEVTRASGRTSRVAFDVPVAGCGMPTPIE